VKRAAVMMAIALLLVAFGAGCARSTTECRATEGEVSVCINGRRIKFADGAQPHQHEPGSLYAPADVLARQLGLDIRTWVTGTGSVLVTVNRKPFNPAMAHGAKGVHVHGGVVYLPLRELALSAGLKLDMNAERGIAGFAR
jgi:hypothetical protein